jgi:hypothetical protein
LSSMGRFKDEPANSARIKPSKVERRAPSEARTGRAKAQTAHATMATGQRRIGLRSKTGPVRHRNARTRIESKKGQT